MKAKSTRRNCIKQLGGSGLLLIAAPLYSFSKEGRLTHGIPLNYPTGPNERIRIATTGMGIMGHADTDTAIKIPCIELAGVCDLYTGRLVRAKEKYSKNLITTRDYRELLNRKDIDAVIIATSDQWHAMTVISGRRS